MEGQPNSFTERFAKSAEARIEADKLRNTHDNAVDLVKNNVDFFGSTGDDQKKSEIALRVLGKFNRGYTNVASMVEATNNPSKNQRIAHGDIDSLAESVQIAMDMSVLGEDLITDSMTAEQIDENLPVEMKGIGKRIKEKRLLDSVKTTLVEKNNVIENGNLFTTQDKVARGEVYKKWGEEVKVMPENSYVRKYVEVAESVFEDLGIKEVVEIANDNRATEEFKQTMEKLAELQKNGTKRKRGEGKPIYDEEGRFVGTEGSDYENVWQLSADYAAEAMKYMDGTVRWQSYTPPEWFKKLAKNPDGSVNEKGLEMQARIEYMFTVNNAAAGLLAAGKDLDYVLKNKAAFGFKNKQMSLLFDGDFKFVTSKMLNELCEFYTDQNGQQSLRYKLEKKIDKNGNEKIVMVEGVRKKIERIEDYEDSLALALAKEHGRTEANFMDKMNAYTAWNLFFCMGDSSLADTMRILPTYEGIISDALRTLNPEYKALGKMQVIKSGEIKSDEELVEAEYFGGNIADYLLTIMKMERDLGHNEIKDGKKVHISKSIDGVKTMRQKLIDGDLSFMSNKMFYGFFDFVNGGRDLYKGDMHSTELFYDKNKPEGQRGEEKSLAQLVMGYAYETDENNKTVLDSNGNPILKSRDKREEFSFGDKQATFMNEFRDSLEGATMAFNCLTGKEDIKDPAKWIVKFKSALGMVEGVKFNTRSAFSYRSDPEFWRDILIGLMGYDERRMSSEYIALKKPEPDKKTGVEESYNLYLFNLLTRDFKISNYDLNINELMRLLGVAIGNGENPMSFGVTIRNDGWERSERTRTAKLKNRVRKSAEYDQIEPNLQKLERGARSFKPNDESNFDYKVVRRNLFRAIKMGATKNAQRLYDQLIKF